MKLNDILVSETPGGKFHPDEKHITTKRCVFVNETIAIVRLERVQHLKGDIVILDLTPDDKFDLYTMIMTNEQEILRYNESLQRKIP